MGEGARSSGPAARGRAGLHGAARRGWPVGVLASKLADERRRLDELRSGDRAVTASFELGYDHLEAEQARAFRLLGVPDGPDLSLAAAAALLELPMDEAEDVLESLVDTSMVESVAAGRYRFHDLVRLFARGKAGPEEGARGLVRVLDFYLASARNAYVLERPAESLVDHLEPTEHEGVEFTDQNAAIDWLFAEWECFLASARQARSGAALRLAVDVLMTARALGESGVNWRHYVHAAALLRDSAGEMGDVRSQRRACSALAGLHLAAGRFEDAGDEARRSLALAEAVDDRLFVAHALNDQGIVANYQRKPEEAEGFLWRALESFRGLGNELAESSVLCNLSRSCNEEGRVEEAVALAEQAVAIHDRISVCMRKANTLYALGIALVPAGRLDEAEERFQEALEIFEHSRQPMWAGMTLFRLGEVHLAAERAARAVRCGEKALAVLRTVGGPWRRATVLTFLGQALHAEGDRAAAESCWREALVVFEEQDARRAAEVTAMLAAGEGR